MVRRRANRRRTKNVFHRQERIGANEDELVDQFTNLGINQARNVTDFNSMGLSPKLLRGILILGLERPAGIQQNAIIPCARGRDVILQAQSGMGKTAAFCIGALQQVNIEIPDVQVLIVTPTRELAEQIQLTILKLGYYMKVNCITCVGGTEMAEHRDQLDEEVHVVIGTLGRLIHLSNLGSLNLSTVGTLIIDESDKMLTDKSFRKNMIKIIGGVSGNAQIILSSATMSPAAIEIANTFMYRPLQFLINHTQLTLDGIKQFYVEVGSDNDKLNTLVELYPIISQKHAMIFTRTRNQVRDIRSYLLQRNISIGSIVGTSHQMDRKKALADFRTATVPVILTTDLLGRGIDVQQVYTIINFGLPMFSDDYIHRAGRCGRYGRKGVVINLVTDMEKERLDRIAAYFETDISEMPTDIAKYF